MLDQPEELAYILSPSVPFHIQASFLHDLLRVYGLKPYPWPESVFEWLWRNGNRFMSDAEWLRRLEAHDGR